MEDKEVALRKKAEIICSGMLHIPKEFKIPFPTSKSSAGPGAGSESIVISFSGMRVKVPISRISGNLELRPNKDYFEILKDGRVYLSNVSLIPTLCHAPGQAFVSINGSCTMGCLFCNINEAGKKGKNKRSVDDAFKLILSASKKPDFQGVAITSGVLTTVEEQIEHLVTLIEKVRAAFPKIPIGVEPLVTSRKQIALLKKAGATEAKVNLEAASRDIFRKICPARNYDLSVDAIKWAVEEFGRNAVTSNIIIGLGESDAEVVDSLEMLGKIGSIGNLRAIRINDTNRERLERALGKNIGIETDRLISLCEKQEGILKRYNLSTNNFKTMCFPCGCCDIVPGIDI